MEKTGQHDPSTSTRPNRLAGETSTYLLQHAHNPVDWFPWGEEAIEQARQSDKPILLSVGYSACHWCHVMAHESFEDPETAALMNRLFVNIKVDREERPDIDEIYMKAVQLLTGHGGWPMTVFLTPDLKPFYGGTYFPPFDKHGLPSFKRLLLGIEEAWNERRAEITESSADIAEHLSLLDKVLGEQRPLDNSVINHAIDALIKVFDYRWGGFGNAPKFPHTSSLSLAMRRSRSGQAGRASREEECLNIVRTTLDQMAYGGIHDQIGGGFARYSVDKQWLIPHFEKMLYDNALLCRNYLDGYLLTDRQYWLTVARGILDFVQSELTTPEGAFYSSLDADSEGEEGKYYVFRQHEIIEAVGAEDALWVNEIFGLSERGNFERGATVLSLTGPPEALAKTFSMTVEEFWQRLNPLKARLLELRQKRVRPGRDEKVLTSWNALMISAFVDGYRVAADESYLATARKAARFILDNLLVDGRLLRTWGRGKSKLNGYLDDYAYFVQALLDLASVDFDPIWYNTACSLGQSMVTYFFDKKEDCFFFTSNDHEQLIARPKNFIDGSTPSATSAAIFALLRLGRLSGNGSYTQMAEEAMKVFSPYFARVPDQFSNMLCALDFHLSPGAQIALVADSSQRGTWQEMLFALHSHYLPNSVIILQDIKDRKAGSEPPEPIAQSPLLSGRGLVDNKATVYICQNSTCQQPINDPEKLASALAALSES